MSQEHNLHRTGVGPTNFDPVLKIERLTNELQRWIVRQRTPITAISYTETEDRPHVFLPKKDQVAWATFNGERDRWGKPDKHTWFKFMLPSIAQKEKGDHTLAIEIRAGYRQNMAGTDPQILAYLDGEEWSGVDGKHSLLFLPPNMDTGKEHEVLLWGYTDEAQGDLPLTLELQSRHEHVEGLFYDLHVPLEVARRLKEDDVRRVRLLDALMQAVDSVSFRYPLTDKFLRQVKAARAGLQAHLTPLYEEDGVIARCVGHTHIDVAWLWRVRQTREKVARSFATALALQDRYPEYVFMYNQVVLYDYLKQDHPALFARIKERVKSKTWEIEGAMWLEPDCNLTSGESLSRQIFYGKRFHKSEFGVDVKLLWLPDTFGYSACMPQLLKQAGIEWFITSKISWNQTNRMPYDTFVWVGIDGSEMPTYFITTQDYESTRIYTAYEGELKPTQVMGAWRRYEPKSINQEIMICFGHGDGGGGPTAEDLERAKRMKNGIPGCPKVEIGPIGPYFERMTEKFGKDGWRAVPRWRGELYLEYHRGTYTSVSDMKYHNRRTDESLRQTEFLSVLAHTNTKGAWAYPHTELFDAWKLKMLNQFHDILPGTSIGSVFTDANQDFEQIYAKCNAIDKSALCAILPTLNILTPHSVVINPTGHIYTGPIVITLPENNSSRDECAIRVGAHVHPVQMLGTGKGIAIVRDLAPLSVTPVQLVESDAPPPPTMSASTHKLSNGLLTVTFDEHANITSIVDERAGRQVNLPNTHPNQLYLFEDKPIRWDAWDIDPYYQDKGEKLGEKTLKSIKVIENGPARIGVEVVREVDGMTFTQKVRLCAGMPLVEFDTEVVWTMRQQLLKVAFPLDINTDTATCEIQYGSVQRKTHKNTSWDQARFEVPIQRWVCLEEGGYGCALLTDTKHGCDLNDTAVRLTLLKGAIHPWRDADVGTHKFRYGLAPYSGDWRSADIPMLASNFCQGPPISIIPSTLDPAFSSLGDGGRVSGHPFFSTDRANVVIDAVKMSETEEWWVVVRMYENANKRTKCVLRADRPVHQAVQSTILETVGAAIEGVAGNEVPLTLRPFEVLTVMLHLSP